MSALDSVRDLAGTAAHPPTTAAVTGLQCRGCGHQQPATATHLCEQCFGPLEVAYDYEVIRARISRRRIEAGPPTLWRYADLLPVKGGDVVTLDEGFTPLIHARNLGAELGLRNLHLKNDTVNPTNSFKDRVVAMALNWALQNGFRTLACASTGNLANSVAAYAARAGLRAVIFIPADLEPQKIAATTVFGATLVPVAGNYDDVNRLCAELASIYDWAFVNVNMRPYYAEGSKTLAFETAEQLGWTVPDHVVVPVASGSLLTKIRKGFDELYKVGLLDDEPQVRVSGAQALGCSPVAEAFIENNDTIRPVKPDTIAKSLAIGNPADGYFALDVVRTTGGGFGAVSDGEIVEGMDLLARTEGIFAETAGGVTVATLKKLAADGVVRPDERVVVYITGHGLKTLEAVAPTSGPTATIAATLDAFHEAFDIEES